MLFMSVWCNGWIWVLCNCNIVGVVVVDLLECLFELISAGIHILLKLNVLVTKSVFEGNFSLINDVFHVLVILFNGILESLSGVGNKVSELFSLEVSLSLCFSSFHLHHVCKVSFGGSNGCINSVLLGLKKSEKVVSVVRVFLPQSILLFLVIL